MNYKIPEVGSKLCWNLWLMNDVQYETMEKGGIAGWEMKSVDIRYPVQKYNLQ